ncbi:MAG: carboxypeptidase-like regulatory domain-containing protein, partial [Pyrinomonadaceae bacterium]
MTKAKTIGLILLLALSAFAQTQTAGSIAGTVKDQTGALIVGATITVTSEASGEKRNITTDAAGNYATAFLASGIYRIRIEANGFSTFTAETVTVRITETTSVNAVLTVAGVTPDPVTVNPTAPLIKTDSPTLGAVFDSRTVAELPLAARNFTQLFALTAGVSTYLADNTVVGRGSSNVSVNGSRVTQNNIQINGIDATGAVAYVLPLTLANPAPESIAELK